jgi:2',3'-cyclic-nucleotide 2'-phosphodiesterase (5'-nucleotidase family)
MQFLNLNFNSGGRFILLPVFIFILCIQLSAGKVVIACTTDIHASKNWFKLATLIKKERAKAGKDNFLLIDCGDTIQGSYAGMYTLGLISMDMLNALKYDVWVPGNHDLDYGVPRFLELAAMFKGTVLGGNLLIKKPPASWRMFNRGGLKIAVIGLGCVSSGSYEPASMRELKLGSTSEYLQGVMRLVTREKPDFIVLAMHNGNFSKTLDLYRLLRRFPEINLIFGGHNHRLEPGISTGYGWFMQSGSHAKVLGLAELTRGAKQRDISIRSRLIQVEADTPVDRALAAEVEPLLKKAEISASETVGTNVSVLKVSRYRKSPSGISELFCRAVAEAAGTRYAFHDVPVKHTELASGRITRSEVYNLMPYQNTICTLRLTRQQLTGLIKEQFSQSRKSGGRFLHPYGIKIVTDRSGENIFSIKLANGQEMNSSELVTVAFSSYAVFGAGGRWPYLQSLTQESACIFKDTGISLRHAVEKYISKHSPLTIKPVKRINYRKK